MRWDDLRLIAPDGGPRPRSVPLLPRGSVTKTLDTPEFRGITVHEVTARSALNKVPEASRMPFRWTINPYRGCSMACTYCLSGDTLVLMADGRARPISEVRAGDRVYATSRNSGNLRYTTTDVRDTWSSVQRATRVTLANGTTLVASADHRFLTDRGWKHVLPGACATSGQRPYLTTNNIIRGPGASHLPPKVDDDYRRGYLTGMVRGDAHLGCYSYVRPGRSSSDIYRFRLALKDAEALDRSRDYLDLIGVPTTTFEFYAGSERHAPIRAIRSSTRAAFLTVTDFIDWPREPNDQWRLGFLAGIFDAEGSHSCGGVLRICNSDTEIIWHIVHALGRFGFRYVVETPSSSLTVGMRVVRLVGGLPERQRFLQMTDPAITRKRSIEGVALKTLTRVIGIEDLGVAMPMYDLTTGTGDFIANGVVSHNCFARKTHEYLDLDSGYDFDSQIVVKTNVGEVLRGELKRPSWRGEHVAMGTNVDCYQRIEGRYRLMRDILSALTEAANPFSILTKSALILRDLDLLTAAAQVTDVSAALSIGSVDRELRRLVEPGAPPPARRLEVVRTLNAAGIPTGVLMAPVLPYLTDSDEQLDATVTAIAASGATYISPIVLHLRPGAREWWLGWLRREHPELIESYARLYRRGSYADAAYQERITTTVRRFAKEHGIGRSVHHRGLTGHERGGRAPNEAKPSPATQLSLL